MAMRAVRNTDDEDISPLINQAAEENSLDPVALLALLKAESGLNPHAERWGRQTGRARLCIASGRTIDLQALIREVWPDVSFGYSQRIVLYHEEGDQTDTVANCLAVRAAVFANPSNDILAAARRLAGCIARSRDSTALGGMVVYNAGSDRRDDPGWMASWAGNVGSYQAALEWAEQFRETA